MGRLLGQLRQGKDTSSSRSLQPCTGGTELPIPAPAALSALHALALYSDDDSESADGDLDRTVSASVVATSSVNADGISKNRRSVVRANAPPSVGQTSARCAPDVRIT
jgi:hypothetical protein